MLAMQGMLCHPSIDHPELCHSGHFSTELHDFIPDSSTEGNSDISHYDGVKERNTSEYEMVAFKYRTGYH